MWPSVWQISSRSPQGTWAIVLAAGVAACGAPAGLRHEVARGETLYRISKAYDVPVEELARANNIADPARIEVGQILVIPHVTREVPVNVVTPEGARAERPAVPELPVGQPFIWPLSSRTVVSGFGPRGATHHDGVDIACEPGTPIHAARSGRVLYSDTLRGYGNIVIIEHDGGYATVYAHNQENGTVTGAMVRQGDVIASCGESGETAAPTLHFEVRKDNVARNPLFYLPSPPAVTSRGGDD
jgi:lipoprotein NlpD